MTACYLDDDSCFRFFFLMVGVAFTFRADTAPGAAVWRGRSSSDELSELGTKSKGQANLSKNSSIRQVHLHAIVSQDVRVCWTADWQLTMVEVTPGVQLLIKASHFCSIPETPMVNQITTISNTRYALKLKSHFWGNYYRVPDAHMYIPETDQPRHQDKDKMQHMQFATTNSQLLAHK